MKKLKFLFLFLVLGACAHQSGSDVINPDVINPQDATVHSASPSTRGTGLGLIPRGIDFSKAPQVVAFGSCANQDAPQPMWNVIGQHNPDVFLFTGDTVYAVDDHQKPVSEQFKKLSMIPEYKAFREKVPVIAIWDDNDYGQRDGGADNPDKEYYKKEFLKHFPYIKDSVSWNQGGLYHVKYIGGSIETKGRRRKRIISKEPTLQVIMLDTRYYRSELKKIENPEQKGRYIPWDENDKSKTVLGEEQWAWFEEQLEQPADLRFIVSTIQLVANQHNFEKWGNFPAEQKRFFELLKKKNIKNAVVLSGDRHRGTIAKYDIKGFSPIFDITASSINRPPDSDEIDPSYIGNVINNENFGLAHIDWKKRRVKFELRNLKNEVANMYLLTF